jgi:hypothetical protein
MELVVALLGKSIKGYQKYKALIGGGDERQELKKNTKYKI